MPLALVPAVLAPPAFAQAEVADALRAALAPATVLSWQRVAADGDAVTLSNVTLRPFGADETAGWLSAERLVVDGVDAEEPAPGFLPAFDQVRLDDVRLFAPDRRGSATIEEIVMDDVSLPARFVAAIVLTDDAAEDEESEDEADTDDDPESGDDAAPADAAPAPAEDVLSLTDALSGLRIGRAVAREIRQVEPGPEGERETLRLDELRVDAVGDGRIGAVAAQSLTIETVQGRLALDGFAFSGLDMLATAALTAAADTLELPEDAATSLDPGLETVEARALALTGPAGEDLLGVERLAVEDLRRIDGDLVAGRIVVSALAMPVAALDEPPLEAALTAMGYDALSLSAEAAAAINPEAETLTIEPVTLDLTDMGRASLRFSMAQFDLEELMGQLQRLGGSGLPALPRATFTGFELALNDDGLTDRLLDHVAAEHDAGRDGVIADVVDALSGALAGQRITGDLHDQTVGAVDAFLRAPAGLVVRAVPANPVSLLELGIGFVAAPEMAMNRLGAEVVYEDRP